MTVPHAAEALRRTRARVIPQLRTARWESGARRLLACAGLLLAAAAPTAAERTAKLLDALKTAQTTEQAGRIEAALQDSWHDQATPSVQLLMDHATASATDGKMQAALQDCDAALTLEPELPDLYRRRAEARFALNDDRGAFADLAQALTREPRLIPALVDLSRFAEARHNNAQALDAWRRVLILDPKTEDGDKRLQHLQQKVNGQPI